jgi:hypothetical protein
MSFPFEVQEYLIRDDGECPTCSVYRATGPFSLSRGVIDEGSLGSEAVSHKGSLVDDSSGK